MLTRPKDLNTFLFDGSKCFEAIVSAGIEIWSFEVHDVSRIKQLRHLPPKCFTVAREKFIKICFSRHKNSSKFAQIVMKTRSTQPRGLAGFWGEDV